jgi:hypothetical protein
MSAHKTLLLHRIADAAPDVFAAPTAPDAPDAADLLDLADLADRPALLCPLSPAGPIPLFENGRLISLADHLAEADAWLDRWCATLDAPR